MKKKLHQSILISILVFIGLTVNAQLWQQTSTPPNGSVRALAIIGTDIYAGNGDGVYFSSDYGVTWVQRNGAYPTMEVYSLVSSGTDIFAATSEIIFGGGGFVLKSTDKGITWSDVTPSNLPVSFDFRVNAMVINGTEIFIGINDIDNGIFKSTLSNISTSSWTAFNTGLGSPSIRSLALSGTNILVGTYGDGVWISPTNNANWAPTAGMTLYSDYIQSLAVSGSNVFAGNISGTPVLYQSFDNGANWVPSGTSVLGANNAVYALAIHGNKIFAGTELGGVFLSTDNGANWTTFNNGFLNCGLNVRSFAFIGNEIFAGTDCGVWKLDLTVGITEAKESSDIEIYPNPNNGLFSIKSESKISTIEILNTIGEKIYSTHINSNKAEIDLRIHSKGVYFYKVKSDKQFLKTGKIIVR